MPVVTHASSRPSAAHPSAAPRLRGHWRWLSLTLVVALALGGLFVYFRTMAAATAEVTRPRVVNEFPHDPQAYCQGLVVHDGALYEGTGKYGESSLRRVTLETGEVLEQFQLDRKYFGEGIAVHGGKLYQLTWRERTAFVYDIDTLRPTGETFRYAGEGWGLTSDGTHLIMSDGTSILRFLDPKTFRVVRRITVQDGRQRIRNLNELEFVRGEIYANVWQEDYIVRISPRTGQVLGWLDLRHLYPASQRRGNDHVLNGIAYDAQADRLFVTGKNWPHLYEIE